MPRAVSRCERCEEWVQGSQEEVEGGEPGCAQGGDSLRWHLGKTTSAVAFLESWPSGRTQGAAFIFLC